MKKIEKLNTVCGVLKTFANEHPDALDAKGLAEFQLVQDRINEIARLTVSSRQDVISARNRRDDTFIRLQRAITESKKAMEMVAARDAKSYVLPRVSKDMWLPNRINMLAVKYLEALEAAGTDPMYVKLVETLNASLLAYTEAWGQTSQKLFTGRTFRKGIIDEITELAGKVDAFSRVIAFHVTAELRKELFARLRDAVPRYAQKNGHGAVGADESQSQKSESDPVKSVSDPSSEKQQVKSAA